MDPDEILEEIRKTTNAILEGTAVDFETLDLYGLCEYVDTLDVWLTGGGTFPNQWTANRLKSGNTHLQKDK